MEHRKSDYDPRIVALYDEDNPDGSDHDYFRALAETHGAELITRHLANAGFWASAVWATGTGPRSTGANP
ncbi:MAG: hypothetical protein ACTIJJ_07820 [Galactobacter sp.]|uniref:hypothetical protein n=1 Tax=Galactobacter sp. TaxID=2676125 RepID=UPI0025BBD2C7|nr:hypothetical protein [Galactobacter sp.]